MANSKILANSSNTITVSVGRLSNDTSSSCNVWITVNGTEVKRWTGQSTGSTHSLTYNYTPTSSGTTYNIIAYVQNTNLSTSNNASTSFKTYVAPTLTDISGTTPFSPQNDITFSWTGNKTALTNAGENYTQTVTITGASGYSVAQTDNSIKLAPSGTNWVQNIYTNTQRGVNAIIDTLTVTLKNNASNQEVSKTKTFTVQYTPILSPTITEVQNYNTAVQITAVPNTRVTWKYATDTVASGYVNGYRLEVFDNSNCTGTAVSTKYVTQTNSGGSLYNYTGTIYYDLNNSTDLKRAVMNYIKITPYYQTPAGTKLYDTNYATSALVKPYGGVGTLTINYPINNTTWHNKNFRVLFTLPEDLDYDTLPASTQSNYTYSNIQIDVNGTVYDYDTTYTSGTAHPEIFSKVPKITNNTDITQKYMAIYPALISGFADASTFTIKVRAQVGAYNYTPAEMSDPNVKTWSDWVTVTLKKTAITNQTFTVGQEIKAEHYMYPHNAVNRLLACYPINTKDINDIDQSAGDQIDRSEYQGVYQTMANLIDGVNNWCTYTRNAVKFGTLPSFTAIIEEVTAADTGTTGKNYMNILTDYMNTYLK